MFKILYLRFKREKKSDLPEIRDWSKRRWSKLKLVEGVRVERCSKFGIIGRRWYQFWALEQVGGARSVSG